MLFPRSRVFLGVLLVLGACAAPVGPRDASPDVAPVEELAELPDEAPVEEPIEENTAIEAGEDASPEAIAPDVALEASPEVGPDAALDATLDAVMDASVDVANDVVAEVGVDAPRDVSSGSDASDVRPDFTGALSDEVRIIAANLTSGSRQSYDGEAGLRILQGLRPDIILMQEFNYRTNLDADFRELTLRAAGPGFVYHRGPGNQIPNGIVSRFPFVTTGHWVDPYVDNRGFTWARIDVPGPQDVFAVSLHLLSSSTTNRGLEATALVALLRMELRPTDLLVLGGDFNTQLRVEPCTVNLGAVVEVNGPYPVDQAANDNTNAPRNKPYDWVVVAPELRALEVPVRLGTNVFPNGLVFDTRVYTPLTDTPGVLMADSAATNMQHMAVVRSFRFPL